MGTGAPTHESSQMTTQTVQSDPAKRRLPSQNRELARRHSEVIYRRVNHKALAISMLAFFATLFTLGWFALSNYSLGTGEKPAAKVAQLPRVVPTAEPTVASQLDQLPSGQVPIDDIDAEFFEFGDALSEMSIGPSEPSEAHY